MVEKFQGIAIGFSSSAMKIHAPKHSRGELFPLLRRAATKWPGDVALVRGDRSLTFSQIKIAAEELASNLLAAGIEPGHKIGLLCPNGPEYVVGSFALFFINGVVVPIFPGLTKSDVTELAVEMGLNGYCYSPQYEAQISNADRKRVVATDLDGQLEFHIALAHQRVPLEAERRRLLKLGAPLIRFTSGTTSKSKGVIIPQSSMLKYTKRFARVYSIQKDDCILNLLSMAHIFYQVTTGMMQGAKLLVEEATDIDAIMRMIQQHRVTQIEATPTFYSMLLATKSASRRMLGHVRYFTSCGAPLADSVAEAFRERFGREIVQRYGLTETGPVLVNVSEAATKRGSLGQPAPGCEIRLGNFSSDDFGEVLIRCPGLFYGYYKPWIPNSSVMENGWFVTGDLARRDEDGYYWMTGRTKTIINVGGVKVFPDAIENLILSHPAVKEAVVYAGPDPRFGEAPYAKVILHNGSMCSERDLLHYANRQLSLFKALRRIEIVKAISKTTTGKISRFEHAKI